MNYELKDYLEIFKELPNHLKKASNYILNHKDRNTTNINSYQKFLNELQKQANIFVRQYRDKLPAEYFNKINNNLNRCILLTYDMVDIMKTAKNATDLDDLKYIASRADRIKELSEMNINDIVSKYVAKENINSSSNVNSSSAQISNNTITNANNNSIPREPSLEQKLNNVKYRQGDNYSYNVTEVKINHELENIQKQIDILTGKSSLTFKEQQTLAQLQLNRESLTNYINSYKNNLSTYIRENKLYNNEGKIAELQERLDAEKEKENVSFLGKRIQKYNIDKLNNRIKKLQQKQGQIMSKQMNKTLNKINRNYKFNTTINDFRAFGQTLGTEIQNVRIDLANRFHSCAKDNTLNNRIQQLHHKNGVMESTYPLQTIQRGYAM